MEEKRDQTQPPNPERQRKLDAAIEKHFGELKRLLDEQRKDLEALRGLRPANGSTEPSADSDLAYVIQHWHALSESVRKRIIDLAKASGVRGAGDSNTVQKETE